MLFFSLGFSQTNRFTYELRYKEDSTSDKIEKVNVILDITGNDVQYYEERAIMIDSINQANVYGSSYYTFPIAKLKRELSSDKNHNYYFINDNYWVFDSEDPINWNLHPETKMKNDWKLQKATTDFGGRKWTAWFTTEIPYSEGPYKFKGLPGLVVELLDSENNFQFELVKISKLENANPNIVETVFKKKPIPITYKKYVEMQLAYYNDPYSRFRNMKPGTWSIGKADGTEIDTLEGLNKATKEEQARIRKENNPIERDKIIVYKK